MISSQQINILSKAFPYMPSRTRFYMDVIIKANQLQQSMKTATTSNDINICSDNNEQPFNPEAFLKDIKPVLSKNEQDNIDMILNLLKTKNIINTYKGMNAGPTDNFYEELFKNTHFQ